MNQDDLVEVENTAKWVQTYTSLITDLIELVLICFTICYMVYKRNKRINQ